jgi:hypothetical protein
MVKTVVLYVTGSPAMVPRTVCVYETMRPATNNGGQNVAVFKTYPSTILARMKAVYEPYPPTIMARMIAVYET